MSIRLVENSDFSYEILESAAGAPLRVGGEMQLADLPNLNRRKYPEALWHRVLESAKTKSRLKERKMLGLLDHPADGKTKLEWPGPSHVMTHLEIKESKRFPGTKAVYGVYECLPTPSGKVLEALLRSRVGVQVSSRGDGDLEESTDGYSTVVPESYDLDTFDVVIDPSVNTDVRVIESQQKESGCSCSLPPKTEGLVAIVNAISDVVRRGDLDESCRRYYTQVLESSLPKLDSTQALKAHEALRTLKQNQEVIPVKTEPVAEAQASGNERKQSEDVSRLHTENQELRQKLAAATKTVEALLVQSRNYKMQADHYGTKVKANEKLEKRYEAAKVVIRDLRGMVEGLQKEAKARIAAEELLSALLGKINESKRKAYVERLLANENIQVQKSLRPILAKCESKREVNESYRAYKMSIQEARTSRGLPPVTESGRRAARISETSPLMETRGKVHTGRVQSRENEPKLGGVRISESVDFTKKLLKASKQ